MRVCIQSDDVIKNYGAKIGGRMLKEAGFEAIDWNINDAYDDSQIKNLNFPGYTIFEKSMDEILDYYKQDIEGFKENDLVVSQAHAIFPNYIKGHPEVLEYNIGIIQKMIAFCAKQNIKNLVVHGISQELDDCLSYQEVYNLNMHLYESLIPSLKDNDVVVCLENLFVEYEGKYWEGACNNPIQVCACIDHLNRLAQRKAFGFCLDTGHLNLLGKDFRSFIPILKDRLVCVHIHDNDGNGDQHLSPFAGNIRWDYFCDALKEIGYEGDLDFEVFQQIRKVYAYDQKLVEPWLKLMAEIGKNFVERIKE